MVVINPFKYPFINPNRHFEGANKQYHISSHKPFMRVYENATYSKPFLEFMNVINPSINPPICLISKGIWKGL